MLEDRIEEQNKRIESLTTSLNEVKEQNAKLAEEQQKKTQTSTPGELKNETNVKEKPHEEPKKESAIEHYKACPTCHESINAEARKELEPDILKTQREKVKSMKKPVVCEGCGEIVEQSTNECPTCHGRKAHKFAY